MNQTEIATMIKGRLGNRTGTARDAQILAEMQFRQAVLEREAVLPWFLLEEASLTVNAEEISLPTGFIREYEDDSMFLADSDGYYHQLDKRIPTHIFEDDDLRGTGMPSAYYLLTELHFFPTPDVSYTGRLFYYKAQTAFTSGSTNAWSTYAPDLMAAETGYSIARYLRDFNARDMFAEEIGDARRRVIAENTARKEAAHQAFLGVR